MELNEIRVEKELRRITKHALGVWPLVERSKFLDEDGPSFLVGRKYLLHVCDVEVASIEDERQAYTGAGWAVEVVTFDTEGELSEMRVVDCFEEFNEAVYCLAREMFEERLTAVLSHESTIITRKTTRELQNAWKRYNVQE